MLTYSFTRLITLVLTNDLDIHGSALEKKSAIKMFGLYFSSTLSWGSYN